MILPTISRFRLLLTLFAAVLVGQDLAASDQTLGSDQSSLEITVQDGLNVQTYRTLGSDILIPQYYSGTGYDTFLVLSTGSVITTYSGGNDSGDPLDNFTPVSNTTTGNTITTVVTVVPNVTITHALTWDGYESFTHSWTIANTGSTSYPACALRYGGDTYFDASDSAAGFYNAATGMLYSVDPYDDVSTYPGDGVMALYAGMTGESTPASSYYEDGFGAVDDALMANVLGLPDQVNSNYVDNGTGLEWDLPNGLPANSTVTYYATESWNTASQVDVQPPATTTVAPGVPTVLKYYVYNNQEASDTFNLQVQASPGITIDGYTIGSSSNPASYPFGGGFEAEVDVTVTASSALVSQDTTPVVSVLAQSQSNALYLDAGATQITVVGLLAVVPPAESAYTAGSPEIAPFEVDNLDSSDHTYTFVAQAPAGITISGITLAPIIPPDAVHLRRGIQTFSGSIAAYQRANLNVAFTADPSLAGTSVPLTFSATAQDNSAITASGVATLDITAQSAQLQVIAPATTTYAPNSQLTLTFTVYNLEDSIDTFTMSALTSSGLTVASIVPSSLRLAAGDFGPVTVVVNAGSIGSTATIALTATSTNNATLMSTATANLLFPAPTAPASTPGAVAAVPSQTIPTSTPGHIVFFPICPSTSAGIDSLLSTLSAIGPEAVAYAWDPTVQSYVTLPNQPSGGLLTTSGVFVATAVPFNVDFSGASTQAPAPIELLPGWNLIGIPPTDLGGTPDVVRTTHVFPDDFTLLDPTSGQPVTTLAAFVSILGDGTSTDITTAYPYYYNGSAYTQVSSLNSGTAYWIKNNATLPVYLESVTANATILSQAHLPRASTSYHGTVTNRGTPPAVPSSSFDSSGSGGGCGASSGVGLVLMLGFFLYRRRTI